MKFFSTNHTAPAVSLKEAVLTGLAPDGGLYMPELIPSLPKDFFNRMQGVAFPDLAFEIARKIFGGSIPRAILKKIASEAFNFPVPLVKLEENRYVLELFHGPTLAFKDFAARFMARLMAYFTRDDDQPLTILVATSGDTGSAVASGFFQVPGIRVFILYPGGKVSPLQEAQLTTMGGNVQALKIAGTFDDCQRLVKQAFLDPDLKKHLRLASANSINIARLIPQSFYYAYAYARFAAEKQPIIFSVPSGNFGNLAAGLIAKRMGMPRAHFVAATNVNDSVVRYLKTGTFEPRASKSTISNAMDVGHPSNFARMAALYKNNVAHMRHDVSAFRFTDVQTKKEIQRLWKTFGYMADPHGAVGSLGLRAYQKIHSNKTAAGIFLETAHPAKFLEIMKTTLKKTPIPIPERLQACIKKPKHFKKLSAEFHEFKDFLRSRN